MKIRIKIPATTTNLGPGFDCLGMALNLYNTVEIEPGKGKHVVDATGEGIEDLSKPDSNWVLKGIEKIYSLHKRPCPPLHLKLDNQIPFARGLGSSAAAYLGGLVGANLLTGKKFIEQEILELAVAHENHPDNVVPAMYGGFVVSCLTTKGTLWIKCKSPKIPSILVAIPEMPMETKKSRKVLPSKLVYADAVYNLCRTGLLVAALGSGRWDVLQEAMNDRLHQAYRDTKQKLFSQTIEAAIKSGALGAALSGSGSTILVFVPKEKHSVEQAIGKVFAKYKIPLRLLPLKVSDKGLQYWVKK